MARRFDHWEWSDEILELHMPGSLRTLFVTALPLVSTATFAEPADAATAHAWQWNICGGVCNHASLDPTNFVIALFNQTPS